MFWTVIILISCIKLLVIPTYRSTDFEVHRNWMAVTHSLPISKWYFDNTSEWTLDYPPLFAWFEYLLSHVAKYFDPAMLVVSNLNYASSATILFQRLSVIVSDLVLAYGTRECCIYLSRSGLRKSSRWGCKWSSPAAILQLLLFGNAGLFIVDQIHFQYNGFLFGVQLLSVAHLVEGRFKSAAFWFAILLNLKHIYIYVAPAYFVYMLRNYCFPGSSHEASVKQLHNAFSWRRFAELSGIVFAVFCVSYGPFIAMGQLSQVLSRLFPFKRGLSHAYWAPNFWALYNTVDKLLSLLGKRSGLTNASVRASMTGGLVQEFQHSVLPSVSPRVTFALTAVSIAPALVKLWLSPGNPLHFVRCLVLCACGSFMFGWHVHEKAVLLIIIPLTLLAVLWRKEARLYLVLATLGHFSLHPLLFTPAEIPLKVLVLLLHCVYAFSSLPQMFAMTPSPYFWTLPLISAFESVVLLGLVPLSLLDLLFPWLPVAKNYPFVPLMLTSAYCALGISYCFVRYYWHFLTMKEADHKRKTH